LRTCTTDFEAPLVEKGLLRREKSFQTMPFILRIMLLRSVELYYFVNVGPCFIIIRVHVGTGVSATGKFDCEDDGMIVFILQKAAISHVAEKLLEMVRETMESAVDPLYKNTPVLSSRLPQHYIGQLEN